MSPLHTAITKILNPIIRILIAKGARFPELSDWMKEAYLIVAERHFQISGKRVTDSRLHLLTGLQRKDIKAIRERIKSEESDGGMGPISRMIGLWLAKNVDEDGVPRPLNRLGPAPSFESLVASVSRDVHLRTIQDELQRLGLAEVTGDEIRLTSDAYVPSEDDAALMGYLGSNLGDHAAAAVENVLAAPNPGHNLERAVHYNRLSEEAVEELNTLSRQVLTDALGQINSRAAELQRRDQNRDDADGRFRAGAFVYRAKDGES